MLTNTIKHRRMGLTGFRKGRVLKLNEPSHPNLSCVKSFEPALDFCEMLGLYRLSNLERSQFKVSVDNPGVIAVVK